MNFESVELENWGPFRGTHPVDLTATESAPFVFIFGDNGQGKTTFAKSILWCLFGEDSAVESGRFANWTMVQQAKESRSSFRVQVRLVFSIDQSDEDGESRQVYEMIRSFDAKPDGRTSFGVKQENKFVSLRINGGNPVDDGAINMVIRRFIPLEMSRFFLFDGEELTRFKTDLEEGANAVVRMSIESVMGIPALNDLDEFLRGEKRKIDAAYRAGRVAEEEQNRLAKVVDDIEARLADKRSALDRIAEAQTVKEECQTILDQTQDARSKYGERKALIAQRDQIDLELTGIRVDIKDSMSGGWWAPLADRLEKSQQREIRNREIGNRRRDLARVIQVLEQSLASDRCETCGQTLMSPEHVSAELAEKRAELDGLDSDDGTLIGFSERFRNAGVVRERVCTLLKSDRRRTTDLLAIDRKIKEISLGMEVEDLEQTESVQSKLLAAERLIGSMQEHINSLDETLRGLRSDEQSLRRAVAARGGVPPDVDIRNEAVSQLDAIIEHLTSTLSDRVRNEVQDVASGYYSTMMGNDDIIGLNISPTYEVHVVNRRLGPKPVSSVGQSLIAVYAFVGALINVSGHSGVWLIDSPGRGLDGTHMAASWQWLAEQHRQIIALPLDRELTPDEAKVMLGGKISARYEIKAADALDADSRFERIGV